MLKKLDVLVILVEDTLKTAKFYKELGFSIREETKNKVSLVLNNFYVDFHNEVTVQINDEASKGPKGLGIYIYVNVDDIDEYYHSLLNKNLKPSSQPRDWPWGNREFVIRDPDGYKIVFYEELKKD